MCAIINSCYDVSEKLKGKVDSILETPEEYDIDVNAHSMIDDKFDQRICAFTNLGKQCIFYLADFIMQESLKSHVFDKLFKNEWMQGETIVASLVETLRDYFVDIKTWIEEPYFYWELVKYLRSYVVGEYMTALIVVAPRADPAILADKIESDVKTMDSFFRENEFSEIKKEWEEKYLPVLSAIYGALSSDIGWIQVFADNLNKFKDIGPQLSKFKDTGPQVLEYIMKLKSTRETSQSIVDKKAVFNFNLRTSLMKQ